MDLFTISGTIWRHRIAALPVILLTLLGAVYVVAIKPPTYQATANILLANPPSPPTAGQIAANPALGNVNANNPYLNYGNLVLVADMVIAVATAPAAGQSVVAQGANPKYTVELAPLLDNPPIIDVTDIGATPAAAEHSTQLVAQQVMTSLRQMQAAQKVNPKYMIDGTEIVSPTSATSSSSSKLRTLVGLLAAGLLLLLVAVSISQSLENRRKGRASEHALAETRTDMLRHDFVQSTSSRGTQPPRENPDRASENSGRYR
jgi:capsular polysaccharide biosynthesis protein